VADKGEKWQIRVRIHSGRRPWLRTFDTLSAAVAWAVQPEAEIRALIERSSPEPEAWPGTV